jgi:hypothetical protein
MNCLRQNLYPRLHVRSYRTDPLWTSAHFFLSLGRCNEGTNALNQALFWPGLLVFLQVTHYLRKRFALEEDLQSARKTRASTFTCKWMVLLHHLESLYQTSAEAAPYLYLYICEEVVRCALKLITRPLSQWLVSYQGRLNIVRRSLHSALGF